MIRFNSANTDHIHSTSTFVTTDTGTWCFWINPVSYSGTDYILGMEGDYRIRITSAGLLSINLYRKFNKPLLSTVSLTSGTLYHVVAAYEPRGRNAIYINGVLDVNNTSLVGRVTDGVITVGASYNNADGFNGSLGGMRHYDRFLSASEISTIYACQGTDGIREGLTTDWPMNELSGGNTVTNAKDIAGTIDLDDVNGTPYYEDILLKRRRVA